ncbi:MAG: LysM peptidoglycan-binding domain-containing protein, partial [Oscillospiraceae bacterium]|nr:LysM peptidoglycan-binding domain-containing protein [Oscillospiraceae bacterium]
MQIHVVQEGQTLFSIGQEYGVSAGIIARYNGLREPYRLAVGQSLLILRPEAVYTVRDGDTLSSVSREFGVPILQLLRNNPNLGGRAQLYEGQTLVLRLESAQTRDVLVNGYAYPFVSQNVLRSILPYTTWLTPFTYGFSALGDLLAPEDGALVSLARSYKVGSLLHLSTLTEGGNFSSERAASVFARRLSEQLAVNTAERMAAGG